jgi:cytochrome c biogenesis protein CcmG, thiol:disulfide interchange protein DsbE
MAAQTTNRWIRGLVFVLAAVLAGMIWVNRERYIIEGDGIAADYEVYSLLGDTINIRDYRGSVVVLNVWATWCGPCVREMPALERLHHELGPEGLEIIGVSVDEAPNSAAAVRAFRDRFGLTFPLLHDPSGNIQDVYRVTGLPTTFIIDKNGRIRQRLLGERTWDSPDMIAELRRMLEG